MLSVLLFTKQFLIFVKRKSKRDSWQKINKPHIVFRLMCPLCLMRTAEPHMARLILRTLWFAEDSPRAARTPARYRYSFELRSDYSARSSATSYARSSVLSYARLFARSSVLSSFTFFMDFIKSQKVLDLWVSYSTFQCFIWIEILL